MYYTIIFALFLIIFLTCFARGWGGVYASGISIYILIIIFSGLVGYTPDWDGYLYWYENDSGRDIFFTAASRFFLQMNLDYSYLHLAFVSLHGFFLAYLGGKMLGKYSGIMLFMYISVVYLFYTTQIRFVLAYFSACLGFFLLSHGRKILQSAILFIFAIINHISIIAIAPIFLLLSFENKSPRKFIFRTVVGGAFFYAFIAFVFPFYGGESYLINYFSSGAAISTAFGGIATFSPYLLSSILIFKLFPKVPPIRRVSISYGVAKWSSRMAIGSMIYFPVSIYYQIVGHRFIALALIFHLTAWIYIAISRVPFFFSRVLLIASVWFWFAFFAYFGPAMFGLNSYIEKTLNILESNELF